MGEYFLSLRAEDDGFNTSVSVGCHRNQIAFLFLGCIDDGFIGVVSFNVEKRAFHRAGFGERINFF